MTWHVALAYYAAAVAGGSLFVALAYAGHSAAMWGLGDRGLAGFFFVYALALLGGFPAQLAYAFTLHRVARLLRWHHVWQWLVAGSLLGSLVLWIFVRLGYLIEGTYFTSEWQWLKSLLVIPFVGPMMYAAQPLWLSVIVAAATAGVLHRVRHGRGSMSEA